MKTIGLFYGSTYGMTEKIAQKVKKAFGNQPVEIHNIRDVEIEDIDKYELLIFGTSAWGIGEMQDDWERAIVKLEQIDFSKKKLALFGLGDQKEYPESFVDGLGILYCRLPNKDCVVGNWPTDGYNYYFSLADKDGKFVGLVLDEHNMADKTDGQIETWVKQLKKELA